MRITLLIVVEVFLESSSSSSTIDSSYVDSFSTIICRRKWWGCSFAFPDGIDGEFITHDFANYVVPAGKNFYITNLKCTNSNAALDIDGLAVYSGYSNVTTGNGEKINMPIIAKEGQSLTHGWPDAVINGILIDEIVTPITYELSTNYIVPSGEKIIYH